MHTANFWSSGARFALGSSGFGSESSKARGNERPVASTSRRPVRSALAIDYGAPFATTPHGGLMPLQWAVKLKHQEIVDIILHHAKGYNAQMGEVLWKQPV